jgi:hypothetical protein
MQVYRPLRFALIGAELAGGLPPIMAQPGRRAVEIDSYVDVRADLFNGWNVR